MSRDPREEKLAGWLRGAFEAGCPAPEVFLEAEWVNLSEAARTRIEAHVATCPACAAQRDLAGLWDLPVDAGDLSPEDLAFVVGKIEESQAEQASSARGNVVPFPVGRTASKAGPIVVPPGVPIRPGRSLMAWGLALAAVLALAIGLAIELRQRDLPELPAPPVGAETYRGSTVLLRGPEGELAQAPARLDWEAVQGAASYRVRIVDPLGEEIWRGTTKGSPLVLPREAAARLQTAVVYAWTVEAVDGAGKRLASSEPLRFRIVPSK